MDQATPNWQGVNLGGWLVLEKWMTPSLFAGLKAKDEYGLVTELGNQATDILRIHRENFITEADFKWIAGHGLNAVRLPVGYWIFGKEKPYVGGIEYVDQAFTWAETYGLKILLDLHGAPGSQNGRDHSGRIGQVAWKDPANIDKTLVVLERLAERYQSHPALGGIELLNEPDWKLGKRRLVHFYERAYDVIRKHCGTEVAVVLPDAYRPKHWKRVMRGDKYQNLLLDVHLYQVFSRADKRLDVAGHLDKALRARRKLLTKVQKHWPIIVGEWSAALAPNAYRGLSLEEIDTATRAYVANQLITQNDAAGWFYWSYKTENGGAWSYRDCFAKGYLPKKYR